MSCCHAVCRSFLTFETHSLFREWCNILLEKLVCLQVFHANM